MEHITGIEEIKEKMKNREVLTKFEQQVWIQHVRQQIRRQAFNDRATHHGRIAENKS